MLRFDERKVMVHAKVLEFYSKLSGHETLVKQVTASVGETSTIAKKEIVKKAGEQCVEEDEFGDDFSYEEMLELESQMMRASGTV